MGSNRRCQEWRLLQKEDEDVTHYYERRGEALLRGEGAGHPLVPTHGRFFSHRFSAHNVGALWQRTFGASTWICAATASRTSRPKAIASRARSGT